MGCARSKEKLNDVDKNISKKHRKSSTNNTNNYYTPRANHHESSIDIVVPETPMSPSSAETIDIRSDIKKENVLNLSQALERSRRQRAEFYSSLLSPPSSNESNHSVSNEKYIQPENKTPVTTTCMLSRSSFQTNLMNEQILSLLTKVNDCNSQHRLNNIEFAIVQNHLVCLIDTLVNSISRLKLRSNKNDTFKLNYNEIKESIYDMSQLMNEFSPLVDLSIKLDITNKQFKEYLEENSNLEDAISKLKINNLIDQLNEINSNLPKEKFTCKCITFISETTTADDLSYDETDFNLDIDISKPLSQTTKQCVNLAESFKQIGEMLSNLNEQTKEENNQENGEENHYTDSTPVLTPAPGQSTASSGKTTSTSSCVSLYGISSSSSNTTNTSVDLKLKLEESKTNQPSDDSINNNSNKTNDNSIQMATELIAEILDNTTHVNYTDCSINNYSSNNELDQESEDTEYILPNREETNESSNLQLLTPNTTDQMRKKPKQNKKKKNKRK